jgi:hypothetical protein
MSSQDVRESIDERIDRKMGREETELESKPVRN